MKKIFFLVTLLLITLSCSHNKTIDKKRDRNISAHTPSEDQFWNELSLEAIETKESFFDVLEENHPALLNQIITDAKDPYIPMFWGQSYNFDSGAKKVIVAPKIIGELQKHFNIKNDNHIVHAGIIHTYGYLFSVIETPYGYKRKRWIAPTLNYAFSLEANSLSPEAIEGGMLSNITFFAGTLAFTDKTQLNLLKNVASEIFTFDYKKLNITRVEEILPNHTLVTTLVKLPKKETTEENDYLLVYSTIEKKLNKELLITAFPINLESFNKIVAPETLGPNQKISVRYNAYLEGLGKELIGTRKLIKNWTP